MRIHTGVNLRASFAESFVVFRESGKQPFLAHGHPLGKLLSSVASWWLGLETENGNLVHLPSFSTFTYEWCYIDH